MSEIEQARDSVARRLEVLAAGIRAGTVTLMEVDWKREVEHLQVSGGSWLPARPIGEEFLALRYLKDAPNG